MNKKTMNMLIAALLSVTLIFSSIVFASAEESEVFSKEYQTSPYYEKLLDALEKTKDKTTMEKTVAVTLSQEGYLNYATEGIDIEKAKKEGKLWTGTELRMNENYTGNTEYTRWAQRYVMNRDEESQYADYDWCAIYVSWCLYQAGYYTKDELKKYYYSYFADPRIFYDADTWIESFNFDQHKCYYVPKAHHKLDAMNWNTYYNVDIDPYDIPYKPGGIVFFSWDTSGKYFDHVAIVVDYDKDTHVLTYSNGNSDGQVITRQIDFDVEEEFHGCVYAKNAERIMGYTEYDEIKPLEKREISVENPVIIFDKGESSGIKIKTDSDSVIAKVYVDGDYLGSVFESNMVFHEGLLTIGKSEIVDLDIGIHKMKLTFEDGEADIVLYITDKQNVPLGILGDADNDGNVNIIDASYIQKWIANIPLDTFNLLAADTDEDGDITIIDASYIQKWLANIKSNENIGKPIK